MDWDVVERELGTRLPVDYVEWSERYPSMVFGGTHFKALAWSPSALIVAGLKEAASWPVVYCPRFRFIRFDHGFTNFLHGIFTGAIRHPELPPDCIGPGVLVDWF